MRECSVPVLIGLSLAWLAGGALGCARATGQTTLQGRGPGALRSHADTSATVVFEALGPGASWRPLVRGAIYQAGRRTVSRACQAGEDPLWFCAMDRWLAGENRRSTVGTPGDGGVLGGTDLGRSVRFGSSGRTFFYMGDSFGKLDDTPCGSKNPVFTCNDAILAVDGPSARGPATDGVPRDEDAADGIDVAVAIGAGPREQHRGFWPIALNGVNGEDSLPLCDDSPGASSPCLGKFNLPTGAVAARLPRSLLPEAIPGPGDEVDVVLLFFATATAVRQGASDKGERLRGSSFLAVSTDGLRFELFRRQPFSRDKFLIVATALLPAAMRQRVCLADPQSPLCSAALGLGGDAVLLFGAGQPPRRSPLHLAVLRLRDLEVFYYRFDARSGREGWSADEGEATPIFDASSPHGQFGETQVTLVPKEACPHKERERCGDTLLLLANQNGGVFLRSAPLSRPASWSRPLRTSAVGYGPFVVDDYTRIQASPGGELTLEMYHVLSSWDGKGPRELDRNPYGVFTRPLRLVDESSCHPSDDGSGIPICTDVLPVWPLETGGLVP